MCRLLVGLFYIVAIATLKRDITDFQIHPQFERLLLCPSHGGIKIDGECPGHENKIRENDSFDLQKSHFQQYLIHHVSSICIHPQF